MFGILSGEAEIKDRLEKLEDMINYPITSKNQVVDYIYDIDRFKDQRLDALAELFKRLDSRLSQLAELLGYEYREEVGGRWNKVKKGVNLSG